MTRPFAVAVFPGCLHTVSCLMTTSWLPSLNPLFLLIQSPQGADIKTFSQFRSRFQHFRMELTYTRWGMYRGKKKALTWRQVRNPSIYKQWFDLQRAAWKVIFWKQFLMSQSAKQGILRIRWFYLIITKVRGRVADSVPWVTSGVGPQRCTIHHNTMAAMPASADFPVTTF